MGSLCRAGVASGQTSTSDADAAAPASSASAAPVAIPAPPADPRAEAAKHEASGAAALAKSDFASAAEEYERAIALSPTASAYAGLAQARDQLGSADRASEAYEKALASAPSLTQAERARAERRLAELAALIATLRITISEPDAHVEVDGRVVDPSGPVRVMPGAHRVVASKAGFSTVTHEVTVVATQVEAFELAMHLEPNVGTLVVTERAQVPLTVYVDGLPAGPTPYKGETVPGSHVIAGSSDTFRAAPQTVGVVKGQEAHVELVAAAVTGAVSFQSSDPLVVVSIDGRQVGQGAYKGELPIGTHDVTFSRPGYIPVKRTVVVIEGRTAFEYASPEPMPANGAGGKAPPGAAAGAAPKKPDSGNGSIGSFALVLSTQLNSMGSQLSSSSCGVGTDCMSPTQVGGGLLWSFGYMWRHFGFDVPMGFTIDKGTGSANLPSSPSSTPTVSQCEMNPTLPGCQNLIPSGGSSSAAGSLLAPSAGATNFDFIRAAAFAALRFRTSYQVSLLRLSAATGIGIVDRVVGVAEQSGSGGFLGGFNGGAVSNYASLAYDLDVAVGLKIGERTTLAFGTTLWVEDAGGPRTGHLAGDSNFVLTRGTQVFLLPHIGFDFGAN